MNGKMEWDKLAYFQMKCPLTGKEFDNQEAFAAHLNKECEKRDRDYLRCHHCEELIDHIGNFISHTYTHYKRDEAYKAFHCKVKVNGNPCKSISSTAQNLAKHIYSVHYRDVYDKERQYTIKENHGWLKRENTKKVKTEKKEKTEKKKQTEKKRKSKKNASKRKGQKKNKRTSTISMDDEEYVPCNNRKGKRKRRCQESTSMDDEEHSPPKKRVFTNLKAQERFLSLMWKAAIQEM